MNNRDLEITLLEQLPPWYREILDYQEMCKTEQAQFDLLSQEINAVADNFFIQTMDLDAVSMWEAVLRITPDLTTENLAFRRSRILLRLSTRPPFTMEFLRRKLDEIIGPGNWTAYVDYPNYTLYIETEGTERSYQVELSTTIGRIKPAHIAYIYTPIYRDIGLVLSETVERADVRWHYILGSWAIGKYPFCTITNREVVKMPGTASIQPLLLSDTASFIASDIAAVRLNSTVTINTLNKSVEGNTLTLTYPVQQSQATTITSVDLLDKGGNVLTSSTVYVLIGTDGVQMKHTIPVKEGV